MMVWVYAAVSFMSMAAKRKCATKCCVVVADTECDVQLVKLLAQCFHAGVWQWMGVRPRSLVKMGSLLWMNTFLQLGKLDENPVMNPW